jgi:hypothetical protein
MASYEANQPEEFAIYVSLLTDEGWQFALGFCPYHKTHTALMNLEVIHSAMLEACLSLNSAMAGMESAIELDQSKAGVYERESSKATSGLLTFSALYASYVDVCRRIRGYAGLEKSSSYSRAINKIISKTKGMHGFVIGLRNFILHYHLVQPGVVVTTGRQRDVKLYLDAALLLSSGFNWKADAREFIQASERIDLIGASNNVSRDVRRLIQFHKKLVHKRFRREQECYELYIYEREKLKYVGKSISDLGAIFGRPTLVLNRLLDERIIKQCLNSSLSDGDVRVVLSTLADRHRNLSPDAKNAVDQDVTRLLQKRPRFPRTGTYIQGRRFP